MGIYIIQDGRFVYVNPALTRVFGYCVAEVIGLSPMEMVDSSDREMVDKNIRSRLTGETEGMQYEFKGRHKDGSIRQVEVYGARVDLNGKPAVLGTSIDITERKRAEAALRDMAERYQAIRSTTTDGFWEIDCNGKITDTNDEGCRMYGYSREELLAKPLHEMEAKESPEEIREHVERVVASGSSRFETRHRCKDGRIVDVEVSVTYRPSTRTFLAFLRDITQRKQAQEALLASEERFRQVADIAGEFIWEVDANGLYTYASPSVGKILGYAQDELVGKKYFYDLFEPSVRDELKTAVFRSFAARQTFNDFPNINLSKGGKCGPWRRAARRCWMRPEISSATAAPARMSRRKQTETELLRERAELAHVARVSTMGELAASVAHELNQPLGAILANAEAAELFLQQDPPALDDLRAILADIRSDDERAGEVIRRMRALLRKREMERLPLDINSMVEDALQLISGDASLRGVSLAADLARILPKVAGDRVHLQQVLLNLIINGMDAMADQPRERRRISVRTRLGGEGRVELAVMDSGHGVEPDKLVHIFEPFYTTKPNGMGMGPSIARTIIEAHRGQIWAEHNPSGGAIFRIELPILEEKP